MKRCLIKDSLLLHFLLTDVSYSALNPTGSFPGPRGYLFHYLKSSPKLSPVPKKYSRYDEDNKK